MIAAPLIRTARRDDLTAIVALLADDPLGQNRENPADLSVYLRAFEAIAAHRDNLILVAELGDVVIGCLQLTVIPGLARSGMTRAQIEGVRVAAAQRGRGVGEMLVHHAIGLARERGCGLVQLTSDRSRGDAHRFYERLGFQASHLGLKLALA